MFMPPPLIGIGVVYALIFSVCVSASVYASFEVCWPSVIECSGEYFSKLVDDVAEAKDDLIRFWGSRSLQGHMYKPFRIHSFKPLDLFCQNRTKFYFFVVFFCCRYQCKWLPVVTVPEVSLRCMILACLILILLLLQITSKQLHLSDMNDWHCHHACQHCDQFARYAVIKHSNHLLTKV